MIIINLVDRLQFSALILNKAEEFGADLAGIADVEEIKNSPSVAAESKIPNIEFRGDSEPSELDWIETGKSAVVIAVSHPEDKPKLDWWHGGKSPPGNQKLIAIIDRIIDWIDSNYEQVKTYHLPYQVEQGGAFLKDAAVMAGLGCIGRNNLLVSPKYGPRLRLRAMVIDQKLPSTGPLEFDPCSNCAGYCLEACPQNAFTEVIYTEEDMGLERLPARVGDYSRFKCNTQMNKDVKKAEEKKETIFHEPSGKMVQLLKYCRSCEFACPIGK